MNHTQEIVQAYQAAGESRRLHLFLSHRDLRQAFMAIDLAERPATSRASRARAGLIGRLRSCLLPLYLWAKPWRLHRKKK